MFESLLIAEIESLGVEARFTLLRFIQTFGSEPSPPITDLDLRKTLGVSRYLFAKAWGALKQGDYLVRGRASGAFGESAVYSVGKATFELLETANLTIPSKASIAGNILSLVEGSASAGLPPARRLLLAVLAAWSDDFGVVQGLGLAELRRLTGLNENRLKIQLNKLRELGFVRKVVPGVSGAHLFGKATSFYFLNTAHPVLSAFWKSPVVFIHAASFIDGRAFVLADTKEHLLRRYAERLADAVVRCKRRHSDTTPGPARNTSILNIDYKSAVLLTDLVRPAISEFQECKLGEYASYLLSNHWEEVAAGEAVDDAHLVTMIASQFPRLVGAHRSVEGPFSEELLGAINVILQVSIQMASDVQAAMSEFLTAPFETMRHRILPRARTSSSAFNIAVLSLPKGEGEGGCDTGRCHILKERPAASDRRVESFPSEAAIPEGERCQFGLLTPPDFGPKRYRYPK